MINKNARRLLGNPRTANVQLSGRPRTKQAGGPENQHSSSLAAVSLHLPPLSTKAHSLSELPCSYCFKDNLYAKTPKFLPLLWIFLLSRLLCLAMHSVSPLGYLEGTSN